VTDDQGVMPDDELEPQGKMFFGGIWWNSTWAEDMDLYDDHEYWRCEDNAIMKEEDPEEDPEEENPKEDPEEEDPKENSEKEVNKGEVSVGDSKDEIFTDSNTTP